MFYICNNKCKVKSHQRSSIKEHGMNKHLNLIIFFMVINDVPIQASTHPICNIFWCTTVATVVHPNTPIKPSQGLDIFRLKRGQKSQDKASIQALRLAIAINHQDLIDEKNYSALEEILYSRAFVLKCNDISQYISFNQIDLIKNYGIYSSSNEDLPQCFQNAQSKRLNKKKSLKLKSSNKIAIKFGIPKYP